MKGFPKTLNTKADYEYARSNFALSEWLPLFEGLLSSRFVWLPTGEVASVEAGVTDITHKVVEEIPSGSEDSSEEKKFTQYELVENPAAKIFRLGYTVSEVEEIVTAVGGQVYVLTAEQPVITSDSAEATGYTPGL